MRTDVLGVRGTQQDKHLRALLRVLGSEDVAGWPPTCALLRIILEQDPSSHWVLSQVNNPSCCPSSSALWNSTGREIRFGVGILRDVNRLLGPRLLHWCGVSLQVVLGGVGGRVGTCMHGDPT
jgi:hypothetical protein